MFANRVSKVYGEVTFVMLGFHDPPTSLYFKLTLPEHIELSQLKSALLEVILDDVRFIGCCENPKI